MSVSTSEQERSTTTATPNNNNNNNNAETALPTLATPNSKLTPARRPANARQPVLNQTTTETRERERTLQRENAKLTIENARLKEELAHLESVTAGLQSAVSGVEPAATFDLRRLRLVQAQNQQLQRQVSLLQSAVAETQQVEASLLTALGRWRTVVDAGAQEATSTGADQSGKDVKWMLAVPETLLRELRRVEAQIHGASDAVSVALASKLRVSSASSEYLRTPATSLRAVDVFGDGLHAPTSHLQLDRLQALEAQLVRLGQAADALVADTLQSRSPPRVRLETSDEQLRLAAFADATRHMLVELGALGAVVSTVSASSSRADTADKSSSPHQLTATQVFKCFAAANSGREREKTLKTQLHQLHAHHVAMANDVRACRRETQYWRSAWQTQADIVTALATRVARLGDKKVQWLESALSDPLRQITDVVGAFQRAQLEGSSRPNAYLPLLVDTLETHQRALIEALSQWRAYTSSVETQLRTLFDDYDANRSVLSFSMKERGMTSEAGQRGGVYN